MVCLWLPYHIDLLPKLEIHVVARDDEIEENIETITKRVGQVKSETKNICLPVLDVVRIRTGERGEGAL